MSVRHVDFTLGKEPQPLTALEPSAQSCPTTGAQSDSDASMGELVTGRFPGMVQYDPERAIPFKALEHIQAGADVVSGRIGVNAAITGIRSSDYLLCRDPVLPNGYFAGGQGISDFTVSLRRIFDKQQPAEMPRVAQILYGAYSMGRLLMPKIIEAYSPQQSSAFEDKVRRYLAFNGHTTLDAARSAVSRRVAARTALVSISGILPHESRAELKAALLEREFPIKNRAVMLDFLQPID